MRYAMGTGFYRHEDTVEWTALVKALEALESRGSIKLVDGTRAVAAVLCAALERERKRDASTATPR